LLEQNADLSIISNFLRPADGEKQKDILFKMLESAERTNIKGRTVSINKAEVCGHVDSLAVVVRMYMDEVVRILRQKGCTGLPEVSEGSLVGMISRRDFRRIKKNPS
jgi:predicted transcriptional regulator